MLDTTTASGPYSSMEHPFPVISQPRSNGKLYLMVINASTKLCRGV